MNTGIKSGKVAQILGIDRKTVTNWMVGFEEFFSSGSLGQDGTQRIFDENDVIILNTIRIEKGKRTPDKLIRELLKGGQLNLELPVTANAVDTGNSLMMQYARVVALQTQLDEAKHDKERLERELREERSEKERVIREERAEKEKLIRQLGKLEGIIEMLREQLDENDG